MRKILKNWGFLLASDVVQQLSGFAVLIILARKLSPAGYGEFNVIISLVTIFAVFANLGMNQVVIREVAVNPHASRKIFSRILPLRLASYVGTIVALGLYCQLYDKPKSAFLFGCMAVIVFGMSLWDVSESIAFGRKITKYSSFLNISSSLLWLVAVVVVSEEYLDLECIVVIYASIFITKSVVYFLILTNMIYSTAERDKCAVQVDVKHVLVMSIPYLWLMVVCAISNQIPVQLLGANANMSEVGYYSVGNKLMIPIVVAISTAFRAAFPFMAEVYSSDKDRFNEYIKKGFGIIVTFGTIVAIIFSMSSLYWIPLIFGQAYVTSIAAFNLLIWYGVISIVDSLLSLALSASYQQNTLAMLATVDLIILLPMLYFGSFHGAYWISAMKLLAGFLMLLYHWIVLARVTGQKIFEIDLISLYGYLLSAMAISILVNSMFIQVVLFVTVNILFLSYEKSPVRRSFAAIPELLNNLVARTEGTR